MDIELVARKFYDHSTYFRGYRKGTVRRYEILITAYSEFAAITTMDQITDKNIREFFYNGLTHKKWKPITFRMYVAAIHVFFAWCVKQGYLEKNFATDIEKPKLEKTLPPKLTKQDSIRLLDIVTNYPYRFPFLRYRNNAMVSMFLFAGLRKSELINLKYADVDIENLTVFVRLGKGGKDRIIPMSFTLAQSLKRYVVEREKLAKTCPEFFVAHSRNTGLNVEALDRIVKLMRAASGIKFSIHKLRHTFATLMVEGGCDIYSLSKMMGHADIKTTTIYLAASVEHLRSQITKHPLND